MNMSNGKPIAQISPIGYFSNEKEPLPLWLENHQKGERVDISELLNSRIIYYPGARTDGSPIRTFNSAHAAHVFLYVDYGLNRDEIESALTESAFAGYHLYHEQDVSRTELSPYAPFYHVTEDERRLAIEGYDMSIRAEDSFAILKIYERNGDFGEEHGASRFTVLYLAADANAAYDALFGNTKRTPYACVVCNNMGSGMTCFTKGSLIELIAKRTNRFPKYLLCAKDYGWDGYRMLRTVSAAYDHRFVWIKNAMEPAIDRQDMK